MLSKEVKKRIYKRSYFEADEKTFEALVKCGLIAHSGCADGVNNISTKEGISNKIFYAQRRGNTK